MTGPDTAQSGALLPDRFGDYRVVALLGEGGMGTVYEAEQHNPKRRVALKVIRPGLTSAEVLRRFAHETAVLARLQHPGIAQIHEAGTFAAPGGVTQPYFAMELVRGVPLTEYASAHALGTRQRLELTVKICEAVEHAHQRGIIHRDLKPANILVDETGQPKILDFGLARLTDSDVQAATMLTDLGQLVGTLPYMSPEQASGEPEELDTRSDVYALGVVCYELLSGRLPHDLHKRRLHEAVRVIREELPSRLSMVDRGLRGDVETIVGKALEKDKTRRYQSAGELAGDIQHYLRNEAISARPASTWYQLRKFARRNRVLVGGVLATFLALTAGLVVSAIQYRRAADARDLAEKRRKDAVDAGDETRAINTFLLDMLGAADLTKLGRDAKVAQALDVASDAVATSFADRPRVEIGVREILARTYISLGMFLEAEPHARRTLELATQLDGRDSAWAATGLQRLASCAGARGDHAGAEALLREAVDIRERLMGPLDSVTLDLRMDLANQLRELGSLEESEAIYRAVLAILRASPEGARRLQVACNSLAVLLHTAGRAEEAESLYRESAEAAERLHGPDHPDALIAHFNVASALESLGDAEQAEAIMAEVLPRIRAVFGDAHLTTAVAMRMLGRLYTARGRPREALPLLREAVDVVTRLQGKGTLTVAEFKSSLAMGQLVLMEYAAAAETFREVVDVYAEQGMLEDVNAIVASTNLAQALNKSGHGDEAEAIYRQAIDLSTRVCGPDDKTTIISLNSLGVLLQGSGRLAEAEPFLERALEALVRAYPPDDPDTAITTHNLMWLKNELGHTEEAAAQVPDLLARFARAFGPRHPHTAQAQASAAFMLRDVGRFAAAEELCRSALEIRREVFGERHFTIAQSLRLLGELRLAQDDATGALPHLSDALPILEAAPPPDASLASCRSTLGECLAKLARYGEAEPLLVEGQLGIEAAPGASDKLKRQAIQRLVDLYAAWSAAEPGGGYAQQLGAWQARLAAPE